MGSRLAVVTGWLNAARGCWVASVLLAALSHWTTACAAESPPLADFFRHPAITVAVMCGVAPSGKGADTASLLRIEVHNGELNAQPMVTLAGFDFSDGLWQRRLPRATRSRQALA